MTLASTLTMLSRRELDDWSTACEQQDKMLHDEGERQEQDYPLQSQLELLLLNSKHMTFYTSFPHATQVSLCQLTCEECD
jgi:hypothetical protein